LLIKESKFKIYLKPFEDLTQDFREKVLIGGIKIEAGNFAGNGF